MKKKQVVEDSEIQNEQANEESLRECNKETTEVGAEGDEHTDSDEAEKAECKEAEKEGKNDVASEKAIPDFALSYLKRHTEIKEVYIDKLGGVFTSDTPKVFLKDAVLYHNPFYKQ